MILEPSSFNYYKVLLGCLKSGNANPTRNDPLGLHIHVVSIAHTRYQYNHIPLIAKFHKDLIDEYLAHLTEEDFSIDGRQHYTNVFFKDRAEALKFYLEVS